MTARVVMWYWDWPRDGVGVYMVKEDLAYKPKSRVAALAKLVYKYHNRRVHQDRIVEVRPGLWLASEYYLDAWHTKALIMVP